ncbi:MAG TPA: hypothetical protein VFG14_20635 [Chthoniobacteraceae bacterium]|nr:hypothetical protein [Chthoniobacteraceae bacterium]
MSTSTFPPFRSDGDIGPWSYTYAVSVPCNLLARTDYPFDRFSRRLILEPWLFALDLGRAPTVVLHESARCFVGREQAKHGRSPLQISSAQVCNESLTLNWRALQGRVEGDLLTTYCQ